MKHDSDVMVWTFYSCNLQYLYSLEVYSCLNQAKFNLIFIKTPSPLRPSVLFGEFWQLFNIININISFVGQPIHHSALINCLYYQKAMFFVYSNDEKKITMQIWLKINDSYHCERLSIHCYCSSPVSPFPICLFHLEWINLQVKKTHANKWNTSNLWKHVQSMWHLMSCEQHNTS